MDRREGMNVEALGQIVFVILTIWGVAYGVSWLIENI
jgi:hypothetical protein